VGVCPQKQKSLVKIQFASKVMLFHETLEFKHVIALCYEKLVSLAFQQCVIGKSLGMGSSPNCF